MALSKSILNRLGFAILGLTNNFAYVIMLSAAYDLLAQASSDPAKHQENPPSVTTDTMLTMNVASQQTLISNSSTQKYCNEHSTSTILLADTLPSLSIKFIYPFLLVSMPTPSKAIVTAFFSAAAFIITGLTTQTLLIFTGVVCASLSSGLGESFYLSNSPLYGDASLSGWSMGTGAAGLVGAMAYALLRMILSIEIIMLSMLIVPITMLISYFCIINPESSDWNKDQAPVGEAQPVANLSLARRGFDEEDPQQSRPIEAQVRNYGASGDQINSIDGILINDQDANKKPFGFKAKMQYLPSLAKYFLPLLLVYFAEYFINQGLFELIFYPEVTYLKKPAQYRWFQVAYQFGVMISRSSLDIIQIKNIWAMSLLQFANALLFLAHTAKLIYIPSFYLVIGFIIYEGLLGGFTYVNTFYRIKKEVKPELHEFCISTVTIADTLGIVIAGLTALPVHNALCKLYEDIPL